MRKLIFIFLLTIFSSVTLFGATPIIIAHRGASYNAPENTLASFRLAWKMGSDAIETDIRLSSDKRIVCIHDDNARRTTGVNLKIAETDSNTLRSLDAGNFKGSQFKGEKIPFLEEVIQTIPPGKHLVIEIKCGKEVLPILQEMLQRLGKASQIVLIAFDFPTICAAKEMMPKIPAYWLVKAERKLILRTWKKYDPDLIRKIQEKNLDGLDVSGNGLTKEFVEAVHKQALKLIVWTIDDEKDARKLKAAQVDGITTNRPDFIREVLVGVSK